ncbi:MAG: NTP transferase domain-containing protein [Lysobacterales bacterium]
MSARPEVWTLVLAAGGSRRLGSPKQALPVGAQTLLYRAVDQANIATPDNVVCVLGAYQPLSPLPCQTSNNRLWQTGMASSIVAGIKVVPTNASVLITVCDQPGVRADHLAQLIACHHQDPSFAVAACYAGKAGVPAVFPAIAQPTLLQLRGDEGARKVLRDGALKVKTVDIPEAASDIDTQADWAQWRNNANDKLLHQD